MLVLKLLQVGEYSFRFLFFQLRRVDKTKVFLEARLRAEARPTRAALHYVAHLSTASWAPRAEIIESLQPALQRHDGFRLKKQGLAGVLLPTN